RGGRGRHTDQHPQGRPFRARSTRSGCGSCPFAAALRADAHTGRARRRRMTKDIAFEMAVSSVRFGAGVTREVGMDLKELGTRLAMVVTDPIVATLPPLRTVVESLEQNGVPYAIYDRVRVEPSDESFFDAIAFGRERPFDAFVAVGGGSTIDTAKAVNLYTTYPPAPPPRLPRLGESADRQGPAGARPAQDADGDSDDGGNRQRDDRRQHLRLQAAQGEDGHRQPPAEADARLSRSGQHAHDAAG